MKTHAQRPGKRCREVLFKYLGYRPLAVPRRPTLKLSAYPWPPGVAESLSLSPLRRLTERTLNPQDGAQPVKQRWALLASNPLRNSRWETHRDDEGATRKSPLFLGHRCERSPMPQKTPQPDRREIAPYLLTHSAEAPLFVGTNAGSENLLPHEVNH